MRRTDAVFGSVQTGEGNISYPEKIISHSGGMVRARRCACRVRADGRRCCRYQLDPTNGSAHAWKRARELRRRSAVFTAEAILSGGNTASTHPVLIAASGMLEKPHVDGVCAIVCAPAFRIQTMPRAPSHNRPLRMTPTAHFR